MPVNHLLNDNSNNIKKRLQGYKSTYGVKQLQRKHIIPFAANNIPIKRMHLNQIKILQ